MSLYPMVRLSILALIATVAVAQESSIGNGDTDQIKWMQERMQQMEQQQMEQQQMPQQQMPQQWLNDGVEM